MSRVRVRVRVSKTVGFGLGPCFMRKYLRSEVSAP